jgi:hypothetical protein
MNENELIFGYYALACVVGMVGFGLWLMWRCGWSRWK